MACRCQKEAHPTRDVALDAQKTLVWHNHLKGRDHLSARLNVYPCPHSAAWHVGRLNLPPPTCYHYDTVAALEAIADAAQLAPSRPLRFSPRARRNFTNNHLLASALSLEERRPLVWFSWSPTWDPRTSTMPHPGPFIGRAQLDEGIIRLGAPAYVAKLRWSDYTALNKTTRSRRNDLTQRGNPADWLATDVAVPASAFVSIDAWSDGAWRAVEEVSVSA